MDQEFYSQLLAAYKSFAEQSFERYKERNEDASCHYIPLMTNNEKFTIFSNYETKKLFPDSNLIYSLKDKDVIVTKFETQKKSLFKSGYTHIEWEFSDFFKKLVKDIISNLNDEFFVDVEITAANDRMMTSQMGYSSASGMPKYRAEKDPSCINEKQVYDTDHYGFSEDDFFVNVYFKLRQKQ